MFIYLHNMGGAWVCGSLAYVLPFGYRKLKMVDQCLQSRQGIGTVKLQQGEPCWLMNSKRLILIPR